MRFIILTLLSMFFIGTIPSTGISQPAFSFPGGLDYQNTYSLNEIFDISPDGKKAAVIGGSETPPIGSSQVAIIDTITGQRFDTKTVQNVGGAISVKFAVLSDGIKVLVVSDNNNGNKYMTIFDMAPTGLLTLRAHTQLNNNPGVSGQGSNIVYSPLTRTAFAAVTGGANRLMSVNLDTGALLQTLTTVVFDNLNLYEDGTRRLIVGGGINTLAFIDYSNPAQMQELGRVTPPVSNPSFGTHQFSTVFSGDGNYVFVGNAYTLFSAINTSTRQVVGTISNSRYRPRALKMFESGGTRFLVMRGVEEGSGLRGFAVINATDPTNLSVVNEMVPIPSDSVHQMRSMSISRNGKRLLVGSPGLLTAYSLPDFTVIWEVPLLAFDSAQLVTFSQPEKIFGAWLHKVFTFPNFTNRTSNFDFDGKTDIGTFRPSTGGWQWTQSTNNTPGTVQWGQAGDIPVPADYDGDDKTDPAVFRPASGEWRILESSTNNTRIATIGIGADVPVPADYDGDGKVDIAVFKKNPNRWTVLRSSDGQLVVQKARYGKVRPVAGDYDGDGKADFATFLRGLWQISNSTGTFLNFNLGSAGDTPVSGDFDNDGKADIAVFEPGTRTWRIQQSFDGLKVVQHGQNLDVPVPADYDGDGKTDIVVFRPSNFTWQILQSTNGSVRNVTFGSSGDVPLTLQR